MTTDRAIKLQSELTTAINDAFSASVIYKSSHQATMDRVFAVLDRYPNKPRWLRAYLDGYARCKWNDMYQHLVFGRWYDGEFYSTHRDRADSVDQRGLTYEWFGNLPVESHHYWKSDPTRIY